MPPWPSGSRHNVTATQLSPTSDLARAILLQVASEAEGSDAVQRLSELIDKIRDSLTSTMRRVGVFVTHVPDVPPPRADDLDSARQSWQTQSASCEDSTATLNSTIANAKSRKANFETQLDAVRAHGPARVSGTRC